MSMKALRGLLLFAVVLALSGCQTVLMSPSGDVAMQQRDLILWSVFLMLLIVVPVIVLTLYFAWRYRASNTAATYKPDWDHSTLLELLVWSAPLMIIIALGAMTWVSTHQLDPYRPLDRIGEGRPIPPGVKPLRVEVVALDWKWLFIYPEQGIATINEMAAPVDRPIEFRITASRYMNSFFIPALAGQIYAMPGMETQLHVVANQPGEFEGFSANYSGAGFSGMRFTFQGLTDAGFDGWVEKAKAAGGALDQPAYEQLLTPSENDPVRRYASIDPKLFSAVVNNCLDPSSPSCMTAMHHHHEGGGHGEAAHEHDMSASMMH